MAFFDTEEWRIPFTLFFVAAAVLFILYKIVISPQLQLMSLVLVGGTVFSAGAYGYSVLFSPVQKLQRQLQQLSMLLHSGSREEIASLYETIFRGYEGLSSSHKVKLHSKFMTVRERIEEQLQAQKKVEMLQQYVGKGNLAKQRQNYETMYGWYQKLPAKIQQEYYSQIVHARQRLK